MPGPAAPVIAMKAIHAAKEVYDVVKTDDSLEQSGQTAKMSKLLKAAVTIASPNPMPGTGRSLEAFQIAVSRAPPALAVAERIGDSRTLARNLEAAGQARFEGAQAQHIIPCQVMRDHELGQLCRDRLGPECVDGAKNGEFLPGSEAARANSPDGEQLPIHRGSHPNYNRLVDEAMTQMQEQLVEEFGSLEAVPRDFLEGAYESVISDAKAMSRQAINQDSNGRLT